MNAHETHRRYFIGFDQSGHRYLIPHDCRNAWDEWCKIPDDNEESWEVPESIDAIRIDGAYVSFCCPTVIA